MQRSFVVFAAFVAASIASPAASRTLEPGVAKGLTTLYAFPTYPSGYDGGNPMGGVIFNRTGDILGTTMLSNGGCVGNQGCGTVFELDPSRHSYTESIILTYNGGNGQFPLAAPTFDSNGNMFVTASSGGKDQLDGTLIEFSPSGSGYQQTGIFYFDESNGWDPPGSALVLGNLLYLSVPGGPNGNGLIVSLTDPGLTETVVYNFKGPPNDGLNFGGNLVADSSGALYGTTGSGGSGGAGTVFKFVPSQGGGIETVLWNFQGQAGTGPNGGVVLDDRGNIYGTVQTGPTAGGYIFKLTRHKAGYSESILHQFNGTGYQQAPAGLILKDGTLYGVTIEGGSSNDGTIFSLSTSGSNFSVLHSFTGYDGAFPVSLLAHGTSLYGATASGLGSYENGTIFRFDP